VMRTVFPLKSNMFGPLVPRPAMGAGSPKIVALRAAVRTGLTASHPSGTLRVFSAEGAHFVNDQPGNQQPERRTR
jgi:hypothetical protein